MGILHILPGWAWVLIFIVGLVFVYGIFNRRWLEEERREAEAKKMAEKPQAVQAAQLKVPVKKREDLKEPVEKEDATSGEDDREESSQ
jgi:flagellar biosynthesis/type III secretory pathway M-ring protein FliF/YscJ